MTHKLDGIRAKLGYRHWTWRGEMAMSILDGIAEQTKRFESALEHAAVVTDCALELPEFKNNQIVELMKEGLSLGDIADIPVEQYDALFSAAGTLLASGNIAQARDMYWMLCRLQPLEERFTYGLAASYQLDGDMRSAGRLYTMYLALNATCIDGRLRLAECFFGAGEHQRALEMFHSAASQAREDGADDKLDYANRMFALVQAAQAGAPDGAGEPQKNGGVA
jgi:tetratricopeptide (TPR) repeat protein